jgi:hypothetical protein
MNMNAQKFEIVKIEGYGFLAQEEGRKPEFHDKKGIIDWIHSTVVQHEEQKETQEKEQYNDEEDEEETEEEESQELVPVQTVGPVVDIINNVEIYEHPYNDLVDALIKKDGSMPQERQDLIWELKQGLMPKKQYKDTTINSYLTYYLQYIENNHALYKTIKRKKRKQHTYYWIIEKEEPAQPVGEILTTIKGTEIHDNPFKEMNRKYLDKGPVEYIRILNFLRQYYKVNSERLKRIEKAYRSYFYELGYKIYTSGDKDKGQVFVTIETRRDD